MRIDIVSLFPGICRGALGESIMGRAVREGRVELNFVNLRDYAHDRHYIQLNYINQIYCLPFF